MSDVKPGTLIDATARRDAIHVALAPVIAGERLVPGAHVGFIHDDDQQKVGVRSNTYIGVVDPYLTEIVNPGEHCWLFLYPQTVTSLRHDWTHPAFKDSAVATSEAWLRWVADDVGLSYETFMEAIGAGGYCFGDDDPPQQLYPKVESIARHYTVVTGQTVDPEQLDFRCAC